MAPGNDTPDTPDVSEVDLRDKHVDELRQLAKQYEISGSAGMRKDELVDALSAHASGGSGGSGSSGGGRGGSGSASGQQGSTVHRGPGTSKSLKYAQEIDSVDDEPERAGRSLVTTDHEVIKQWAQERDARPATVEGTEHDGRVGVLRFTFGGSDSGNSRLREISWDDWFETFDARTLNFMYQETRTDGQQSNFFRLENPNREDA